MNTDLSVATWLKQAQQLLESADIATARLDSVVLLEDCTQKDRTHLLAHPELDLTAQQIKILAKQLTRRAEHEPLAYIRQKAEFYGRDFMVSPHTLVPRPETETMITVLKSLKLPPDAILADIGTGSGCIAIVAALELPGSRIDAYEIDPKAFAIAQQNAKRHNTPQVRFHLNDLLGSVNIKYDVVLANLPYVPDDFVINKAAMQEPRHAIFGGKDGLELYRRLSTQLETHKPHYVLTEALPPQHSALQSIMEATGFTLQSTEDFIQLFVRL
jgi:release factor glutamine methyltransferase